MTWHKLRTIAAAGLVAALACGGSATFALQGGDPPGESFSGARPATPPNAPRVAVVRRADAAARFAAIMGDLINASIRFYASSQAAGSPSTPKSEMSRKVRELGPFVDRLLKFARSFRGSPEAVDALAMVASMQGCSNGSATPPQAPPEPRLVSHPLR